MSAKDEHLNVTAVKQHGTFLQIIGHHKAQILADLEEQIQSHLLVYKQPVSKLQICPLQYKTVYLANNGGKLYRSVLIKQKHGQSALMEFIDYGIDQDVAIQDVSKSSYQ